MAKFLFSSKFGGVSAGDFAELNLGNHVGDLPDAVLKNRTQLRSYLALQHLVFMNQSHGSEIFTVEKNYPDQIDADALITSDPSIGIAVLTADCIPLLIDAGNCVAAVHVGRKGLAGGIIPRVLEALINKGGSQMKAWIGPAICGQCYEVSPEIYADVVREIPETATSLESHRLDLPAGAIAQLREYGVATENFHRCTLESPQYYSYRGQARTGRFAGVISL